jgi:hypothetical protein
MCTRVSHSQSVVEPGEREEHSKTYEKAISKYVMTPANAIRRHPFVEERTKKLTELAQGIVCPLVVAILAPKGACSDNLLKNCPALATPDTKQIKTSHGGISLNCFVATI